MGFLLRCGFWLAILGFILLKSHDADHLASAPAKSVSAKAGPIDSLQQAATERLAEAAKKHCRQAPQDCLFLLRAAGAEAAKRVDSGR